MVYLVPQVTAEILHHNILIQDQLLLIYARFSVGKEQLISRQAVLTRLFCPRLNYLHGDSHTAGEH